MLHIREAVKDYGLSVEAVSYQDNKTESLSSAIRRLEQLDYVYHFGIVSVGIWKDAVLSLYRERMLTKDRVWIYADALIGAVGLELEANNTRDRDLARALNRSKFIFLNEQEQQLKMQKHSMERFAQNATMVDYFLSRHTGPLNESLAEQRDILAPLFQDPSMHSLLAYDAVMALGIAACRSSKEAPSGPELFETLRGIEFHGATGRVALNNDTGTRQSAGVQFQVMNHCSMPNCRSREFHATGREILGD